VPHNFIKIDAVTPNPGLRTQADVAKICKKNDGKFKDLWFDDEDNPTFAYVLVENGKLDGILKGLHGHEVIRLFDRPKGGKGSH
jgi:hypothetical protein